jgi:hypothetical protein
MCASRCRSISVRAARVRARVHPPVRLRGRPHNTLIAFWRTADDTRAFAARPEHRAAARDLYQQRSQYSHFAAV